MPRHELPQHRSPQALLSTHPSSTKSRIIKIYYAGHGQQKGADIGKMIDRVLDGKSARPLVVRIPMKKPFKPEYFDFPRLLPEIRRMIYDITLPRLKFSLKTPPLLIALRFNEVLFREALQIYIRGTTFHITSHNDVFTLNGMPSQMWADLRRIWITMDSMAADGNRIRMSSLNTISATIRDRFSAVVTHFGISISNAETMEHFATEWPVLFTSHFTVAKNFALGFGTESEETVYDIQFGPSGHFYHNLIPTLNTSFGSIGRLRQICAGTEEIRNGTLGHLVPVQEFWFWEKVEMPKALKSKGALERFNKISCLRVGY